MSAGVALDLCNKYPSLRDITCGPVGTIVKHSAGQRVILNMVTKAVFYKKPEKKDFEKCLNEVRNYCGENLVQCIAIPKLGTGRDGLNWDSYVLPTIRKVFRFEEIEIHVYHKNN